MKCIAPLALFACSPLAGAAAGALGACRGADDPVGSCLAGESQAAPPAAGKDHLLMQFGHARLAATGGKRESCCDGCQGTAFCSPVSRRCYETRAKPYYQSCGAAAEEPGDPSCCDRCEAGRPGFCSPLSGNCYETKAKDYYGSCPSGGLVPPERRLAASAPGAASIKFMSYNLFGWNAFNANKWRSAHVLDKIRAWKPAVLGAQEVETGGGHGGAKVAEKVIAETGLSGGVGGSQFYDSDLLEAHEHKAFDLVRGYWMSMTRYTHRASNVSFLFFNSHWKHGYGAEQKVIIANAINEERQKYGSPPTILVGDTNQFCLAHEKEAIRYLKGEEGSSPVVFVDAIAHDKGLSYDGGCRVDFILASAGQWHLVQSSIDRDGMGVAGVASDHAALLAELVPVASPVSVEA